ncbi:MAG: epoxyqueuosine reductase, partial [Planctomycetaceae bacterium]
PADPLALLSIGDAEFNHRFGRTPLARPGSSGLRRNAAIVVGNSGDQAAIPKLAALVNDPDAVVRGAVAWALGELGGEVALRVLRAWSEHEVDAAVRAEITTALAHAE